MPLSNDVNKRLVTITVTIKVYADGDIERSVFDNLLSEEVLAKTGETTVSSSIIKDLDLDFSYNEKNYKSLPQLHLYEHNHIQASHQGSQYMPYAHLPLHVPHHNKQSPCHDHLLP
jgi:hypothetical protein